MHCLRTRQIDDQEAELDIANIQEIDHIETLHRLEIARGLRLAAGDRRRAVQRERMRWAVSNLHDADTCLWDGEALERLTPVYSCRARGTKQLL